MKPNQPETQEEWDALFDEPVDPIPALTAKYDVTLVTDDEEMADALRIALPERDA